MMMALDHAVILGWLRETDAARLEELFAAADATRQTYVGSAVHLRGLVEISNHCCRLCHYCGLRAANRELTRYRMSREEILACASLAVKLGYGTLVVQAGEDPGITREFLAEVVRAIKAQTPLAVTLSMGERSGGDLAAWKHAGADRYLLRFETSDLALFNTIHPSLPGKRIGLSETRPSESVFIADNAQRSLTVAARMESDRLAILRELRTLGYEIGSGIMVGIPGQTLDSIAHDILLFRELDLDMIGIGPFIPHPDTPLGANVLDHPSRDRKGAIGVISASPHMSLPDGRGSDTCAQPTELMVYKAVALTRLVCPGANIPSTSALATINQNNGRELGLARGANVIMPNLTPQPYRSLYQIYPNKACITEEAVVFAEGLRRRILAMDRTIGIGPGRRKRDEAAMTVSHDSSGVRHV
ncbi:MAG: [FeFe] hydrogenase H-cluster radical SAM maturase HydE [Phycisphaerales bacterium]|nr:[FeFe] hydrogenase H-cluster radical SAM maturase HydE [Phycisphaerales bacterium]